ncbi:MAG: 50S ribosomal protein L31 [Candidatus Firestonebacteria bacterium]|jgi:large subunit ribosomal protein L31|nr:50S ribosomal protein L31 [Candidatus Firestonebacteria bacterium]
MKEKIHPSYKDTEITCTCGAVIKTRSTKPALKIEVCSNCHPFYTGQQKFLDVAGRVEKFKKSFKKASSTKTVKASAKKPASKAAKKTVKA